jgi:hypothetical protein
VARAPSPAAVDLDLEFVLDLELEFDLAADLDPDLSTTQAATKPF